MSPYISYFAAIRRSPAIIRRNAIIIAAPGRNYPLAR
jgi:hypothetical protein